jgi:hypothetical protein
MAFHRDEDRQGSISSKRRETPAAAIPIPCAPAATRDNGSDRVKYKAEAVLFHMN